MSSDYKMTNSINKVPWNVLRSYDCLATEIKKTFLNNLLQKLLTLKSK